MTGVGVMGELAVQLLDEPREDDPNLRLVVAVLYNHAEGVEAALQAGAEARLRDAEGVTVLAHAIRAGAAECLPVLLRAGADPADLPDGDHLHPVAAALRAPHRRFELAAALLQAGVSLEAGGSVRPAVADAVERNDAAALRWILTQGGWPGEQRGRLLISRARSRGLTELADMLALEAARRSPGATAPAGAGAQPQPDPSAI